MAVEKDSMEGVPPLTWIAHPVRVQLVVGGSDQSVDGNLYTIDPLTGSLVLVRFHNEKPWQVSWIPREGYSSVSMIDEPSPHSQRYSVELADMMSNMFGMRQVEEVDANELKERRQKLLSWLRANHVDVKECDDGSLLIFGAARIQSPFTEDSCYCDNTIVLKRLRALVGKVPK
uniref:Gemin6_C domain-containing protein n=1 Tax=Haemonchus contortus TaxID=6289 RepID=A0A7I4XU23_HAECO|nr:gem-associated protein 6-like protein [Haemonchus contortus]